jgi:hypothetical protein
MRNDNSEADVVVMEISGRRFGDPKKKGKNTFCGESYC